MSKNLMKEAIEDVKSMKDLAIEAAKNELVESLSPLIKEALTKQLKHSLKNESVDRVNGQGSDYYSPSTREKDKNFQESSSGDGESSMDYDQDDKEMKDESALAEFFPVTEMDDQPYEESSVPGLGEDGGIGNKDDKGLDNKVDGDSTTDGTEMGEEVEISNEQLESYYESLLKTEMQIKKGFSDMTTPGELEKVDPTAGIADVKTGVNAWDEETPPNLEKWAHLKEGVRKGMLENKKLREALALACSELKKARSLAHKSLQELHNVNLFNSKMLHVNKLLNSRNLTTEQKSFVVNKIDKARNIEEVKMVFETIVGSFSLSLNEGKKPVVNAQRVRTSGASTQVLSESADRGAASEQVLRMQRLAGLVK